MNITHLLFSYGTLQLEKVQKETFGRILKGTKDKLFGYKIEMLRITDPEVLRKSQKGIHPIAIKSSDPNDFIEGTIL